MKKFVVLNGPNINLLGKREPEIYGTLTLADIQKYTEEKLKNEQVQLEWHQANHEGELIDVIHQVFKRDDIEALIINPGAYSHTSVAIYDALKILKIPIIEVHLTNIHSRESFRQSKITAKASTAILEGLHKKAYLMAIFSQLFD